MGTSAEQTEQSKANMLKALKVSHGIALTACEKANIGRTQYYQWLQDDGDFKKEVDNIKEEALDFTESKLFDRINGYEHKDIIYASHKGKIITKEITKYYPPDTTAIKYYLSTQGKKRGFVERQEITGGDGAPLIPITEIEIIPGNARTKDEGHDGITKPLKLNGEDQATGGGES